MNVPVRADLACCCRSLQQGFGKTRPDVTGIFSFKNHVKLNCRSAGKNDRLTRDGPQLPSHSLRLDVLDRSLAHGGLYGLWFGLEGSDRGLTRRELRLGM